MNTNDQSMAGEIEVFINENIVQALPRTVSSDSIDCGNAETESIVKELTSNTICPNSDTPEFVRWRINVIKIIGIYLLENQ